MKVGISQAPQKPTIPFHYTVGLLTYHLLGNNHQPAIWGYYPGTSIAFNHTKRFDQVPRSTHVDADRACGNVTGGLFLVGPAFRGLGAEVASGQGGKKAPSREIHQKWMEHAQ